MEEREKVLIVDDEELIRMNLRAHFEDMGYRVAEAANGKEGLDVFSRERPDIVFTDLRMPQMDGLPFIAALRQKSPETPVVVISGAGTLKDAIEAIRLGAWDYVTKPVEELEELEITTRRALERARLLAENEAYRERLEDVVKERTLRLHESEEQYRALVELSPDAIFIQCDGRFVYVNPAGLKLFGARSSEQILGRQVLDLLHPDYRKIVGERIRKVREDKSQVSPLEEKYIRLDGTPVDVEVAATPFTYQGKPAAQVIVRDITERKEAEDRLAVLYETVKEEVVVSSSLLKIVETLNATLDERTLVRNVTKIAPHYLKFDRVFIFLYEGDIRGFTFSAGSGLTPAEEGMLLSQCFREGDFPALDMLFKGDPVILENDQGSDLLPKKMADVFPSATMVIMPLSFRGNVVGGIIGDYRSGKHLETRDMALLKGLADALGMALQNSRLYRESVERLMELSGKIETIKAMSQLDREILSNIDKNAILRTATALINKIIPCDRAAVILMAGDRFTVASEWGIGEFSDRTYAISGSHCEIFDKSRISLYRDDIAGDDCPYHKEQGAMGIKSVILVPLVTKEGVIGFLDIGSAQVGRLAPGHLSTAENIASQLSVALENARLYEELQQLLVGTITSLASAIDAKSTWTKGHSERVTRYAMSIGKELGLEEKELERLKLAGLLHDIGKIGTYDVLLDKPGKLTDEEFELVKKHPRKGAEILAPIRQLNDVIPGILHHHERYDGRGYPDGLKGEGIPLQARILCVADAFDSMTADRPYRPSPGKEYAVSEFKRCLGTQFDPLVAEAFLRVMDRNEA